MYFGSSTGVDGGFLMTFTSFQMIALSKQSLPILSHNLRSWYATQSTHESSTIEATIQRNLLELNNAILKVTAHDELVKQGLTYTEMSFFVI